MKKNCRNTTQVRVILPWNIMKRAQEEPIIKEAQMRLVFHEKVGALWIFKKQKQIPGRPAILLFKSLLRET